MKVLHISNDYTGSKVHSNLIRHLDLLGLEQIVYSPVKRKDDLGKNLNIGQNTTVINRHIVKSWYKYFYFIKRLLIYKDLKKSVNLNSVDLMHATTLYSDGGVAYKAFKEYGIPYIVAVRSADINVFSKYLPYTKRNIQNILINAKEIVFISTALKDKFERIGFVKTIWDKIKDKIVVRFNGIDNFWLENIDTSKKTGHKILYIGNFQKRKNVPLLIKCVNQLRKENGFQDTTLTIVGGGKDYKNESINAINENQEFVVYKENISDKEKLLTIMREHSIFAMPSYYETFGLVYIEALSQNLSLLYTKGQGVDRVFQDYYGIGVNPYSEKEITDALRNLLLNLNSFFNNWIDFSLFDWKCIAKTYLNDYNKILS